MNNLDAVLAHLDHFIEQKMQAAGTPGLAIGLANRETLLHVATYGVAELGALTPVTPEHLFQIGSIGKSFTAVLMLQLHQEGKLDLHAPVTEYLPWFHVGSKYKPVTLHHLLTHTAGLIAGTDFTPNPRYEVWALRHTETGFAPGSQFFYSNVGYKVLGLVLESLTGQTYGALVQQRILDPLGMADTDPVITHETRKRLAVGYTDLYDDRPFHLSHPLVPASYVETNTADGCLASTAADMARYVQMLLNRGAGGDGRIISEGSYALMTQPATEEVDYGYGLYAYTKNGREHLFHSGDMPGYMASIMADVSSGLGVVVLMTKPPAYGVPHFALQLLQTAVAERPLPVVPPRKRPAHVEKAAEYAGHYRASDKELVLLAENEQLLLRHGEARIPLEPRGEDQFYLNHPDFDLFLLEFGRVAGQEEEAPGAVVELYHGADWYTNERYSGPTTFEAPQEWLAYGGHYRAHNPWASNFRVVLRKGDLYLIWPDGKTEWLEPLSDNTFRTGSDPHSPERISFYNVVGGKALRANRSGCDYYRFFTP